MSAPLRHVARAADYLNNGSGTPQEKLIISGKIFRTAMICQEDWPPDLFEQANGIYATLLKCGKVRTTVARMNEETASRFAKQLGKDMADLVAGIEQARSEGRLPAAAAGKNGH
jgi:hypothetical protein